MMDKMVAEKDKVRFKSYGVNAALYLTHYYNNIKKDKETALSYTKRGLDIDPTNETLLSISKALSAPQRATPTRTSTSSNSAKDGETKVKTDASGAVKKVKAN